MSLIIDKEFKALIPPLTDEEYKQLETNCIKDGILESIKTWQGVIVDGHNRYEIANNNGIPYKEQEIDFKSRADVIEWIIQFQMGRRNLTEEQKAYLRGKRYENEKLRHGGERSKSQKMGVETHKKLASEYGVSKNTILNDADFAAGVDMVAKIAPEAKKEILSGKSELTKQDVQIIGKSKKEAERQVKAEPKGKTEAEIDAEIEARAEELAKERLKEAEKKKPHRAIGTGENEWYTPAQYIEMARHVMCDIDLDPASCEEANKTIKAKAIFTAENSGLDQVWGGRIWLNPPYSRELMPAFIEKLEQEYKAGSITDAIVLSHNNTDTAWFHKMAAISDAIAFPKQRIKFYRGNETAAPVNGQAFFYIGEKHKKFASVFSEIGFVVKKYE